MSRIDLRLLGACAFIAALLLPFVLRASGVHLPGTQPSDGSGDPAFPPFLDGANPGSFDSPEVCDNCHAGYRAPTEPIHEPWNSWAGTLMGNAARDPLFWAAVDIANQDDALLGDVGVGDMCLRCHLPVAWFESRSSCATAWGEEFDGACAIGPPTEPGNDYEGLTCHFCHRIYDASDPPPGEFLDPAAPRLENSEVYLTTDPDTMLGPYDDAAPRRHQFRHSPFQTTSAFCGQCHDVTNPARNRRDPVTGADLGYPMPVERTWSEYSQSALADPADPVHATCQDCHMPPPDLDGDGVKDPAYAVQNGPQLRGDDPGEGDFHPHWFAGGGSWMIEVLQAEYGTALNRNEEYEAARQQSLDLLTRRSVELAVDAPPSVVAGQDLSLDVTVTNLAGHKFPTGYPEGRRAWLRLRAGADSDGDGSLSAAEASFTSGLWDGATGELQHEPQEKIYEIQLGVWDWNGTGECDLIDDGLGRKMFHFVLNDCVVKDDRIPPLGFVPNDETAPVGHVYPDNPARPGTLLNADLTSYLIPVPPATVGPFLVEVDVLYQTTSKEYVEFLRDANLSTCDPSEPDCDPSLPDPRPNRGERMFDLWEAHGRATPVLLARETLVVDVEPAPPLGACCIGGDCFDLTESDCLAGSGTWEGEGTTCLDTLCPQALGACCVGPDCSDQNEADCLAAGGDWKGEGTSCLDTPCPPALGACCVGLDCSDQNEADCLTAGGDWKGEGTSCLDTPCPPALGACCIGPACSSLSETDCLDAGGEWRGEGIDCADVDCALPPAPPGEARDLRVARAMAGTLSLAFTPACDATDYSIIVAPLSALGGAWWSEAGCGLGVGGLADVSEPSGSVAFVVVGLGPGSEGSYGHDSFAVERPERDAADGCDRPQDLGATCD